MKDITFQEAIAIIVVGFFTAVIIILIGGAGVYAIPVQSEMDFEVNEQNLYIGFENPNQSRLFFKVSYFYNGTVVYDIHNSNSSGLIKLPMPIGYFKINATDTNYNNRTAGKGTFRIGSIMVTGVKAVYVKAFKGDLLPVAMTILFAVGFGAVSLGIFAGLPIMIATLTILTEFEYLPGWPRYIMLFVTIAIASKYLYEFVRE